MKKHVINGILCLGFSVLFFTRCPANFAEQDADNGTTMRHLLRYDGNGNTGGTVPAEAESYAENQVIILLDNIGNLVKTDHFFAGWNSRNDGGGSIYSPGQTIVMGTADITIYAFWTIGPFYRVSYDDNDGTEGTVPVDPTYYTQGQVVTVLGNSGNLLRINSAGVSYRFNGWNTQADGGGTNYSQGQTFSVGTADITLYARWIPYGLRDTGPAGGLVFHDKGNYNDGWRYLEAAPASTEWSDKEWGAYGTLIGGTSTITGTGESNTSLVTTWLIANSETDRPALLCSGLVHAGYDDWFLPSQEELTLIHTNLHLLGFGGFTTLNYWSSSEESANNAWGKNFTNGNNVTYAKNFASGRQVRAARAF